MDVPTQVYMGCQVPPELAYDVERDVWVRLEEDGTVTLGMTDLAQTRSGKVVSVLFKAPGRVLRAGQSAATIESAKWVGPFPTPISGEIVAHNQAAFDRDILVANRDPYGAGWLVRLRPSQPEAELAALTPGAEAWPAFKARIDRDQIRCYRCAD